MCFLSPLQILIRETGRITITFGAVEGWSEALWNRATVGAQGSGGRRGVTYRFEDQGGQLASGTSVGFVPAEAGVGGPEVQAITATPWMAGLYEVRARIVHPEGAPVAGADFSATGMEMDLEPAAMFSADGAFDSAAEEALAYLDGSGLTEGELIIRVRARDDADRWGEPLAQAVAIDRVAPVTTCTVTGPAGEGEWLAGPAELTCTAADGLAGVDFTEYRLLGGDWERYDGPVVLDTEGITHLQVRSFDRAGNGEAAQYLAVAVDTGGPAVALRGLEPGEALSHAGRLLVGVEATDAGVGVAEVEVLVDAAWQIPAGEPVDLWRLPLGHHTLQVIARDWAGHMTAFPEDGIAFTIFADYASVAALLDSFTQRGLMVLPADVGSNLRRRLAEAEAAEKAGDRFGARRHLTDLVEEMGDLRAMGQIPPALAALLVGDVEWIIARLTGQEDCGC